MRSRDLTTGRSVPCKDGRVVLPLAVPVPNLLWLSAVTWPPSKTRRPGDDGTGLTVYSSLMLSAPGRWVSDKRGDGRGVRVSAHVEAGFLVLSTWKSEQCVGTVRLLPDEAAQLVSGIAESLAHLAKAQAASDAAQLATRLADVEARLATVEQRS